MRLISETGIARAVKRAYRHGGGYIVLPQAENMTVFSEHWRVTCPRDQMPRRVLAVIVEHAGLIPDSPSKIEKDMDAQLILEEEALMEMSQFNLRDGGEIVTMVPIVMQALQIFQPEGGGACYGTSLFQLGIVERDAVEHGTAVAGSGVLYFSHEKEQVYMPSVRKAKSSWAKEWERAVWEALESVDLHRANEE